MKITQHFHTQGVIAYYSRLGYRVCTRDGAELYRAGNHRGDSQASVPADSAAALPLRTLRKYARQTGLEMAKEIRGVFCGVEREDEE